MDILVPSSLPRFSECLCGALRCTGKVATALGVEVPDKRKSPIPGMLPACGSFIPSARTCAWVRWSETIREGKREWGLDPMEELVGLDLLELC